MYFFQTRKPTHHFQRGLWKCPSLTTVIHYSFSTESALPGQGRWELGLFLWLDMSADVPSLLHNHFVHGPVALVLKDLYSYLPKPRGCLQKLIQWVRIFVENPIMFAWLSKLTHAFEPMINSIFLLNWHGVVSDQKCILGVSVVVLWSTDCFTFCPVGEEKNIDGHFQESQPMNQPWFYGLLICLTRFVVVNHLLLSIFMLAWKWNVLCL